jgi:predicted aspartyl protease
MIALLAAAAALTVHGDRLFVPARINGVETEAVLDSAAEATVLDDGFAKRVGAGQGKAVTARGSGGKAEAQLVEHVRVEAVGVALPDVTVAVIDLDDVGKRLFGGPLDAIVGRELFDATRLAIDIEGGTIRTVPAAAGPRGVRLPLRTFHGIETVPVSVEGGRPVQAEFDLGNGSDMLIGKAYAVRTGLIGRAHATAQGGGIGGAVHRKIVTLKSVRIAGLTFRNVRAAIDEQSNAADANIGVRLLRRFRITTDFARKAVWLEPRR